MKRTSVKLKLKQRLELVRTTVRVMTSAELEQVKGGDAMPTCACYYSTETGCR